MVGQKSQVLQAQNEDSQGILVVGVTVEMRGGQVRHSKFPTGA